MPYRKERKISEYHTRRPPKCKYCHDPVKQNIINGRNKGYCKTCGKEECITASFRDPEVSRKVVDHDHKTGRVRGVICNGCNMALHLVENEERLQRALDYLKNI